MVFKKKSHFVLFLVVFIFSQISLLAQNRFTISGIIKSKKTGESIIGASLRVLETNTGATSNEYGFYSLSLVKGIYSIEVTSIGKMSDTLKIDVTNNISQNIFLSDESKELTTVVVRSTRNIGRSIAGTQTGVEKLSVSDIKNIPVLLGEKDVLKTIQLLPGIKSAGDGNAGFFVRGGTSDQNQIMLDEANVYNASHLLGFFSTFNSDAIKDITVYKGGMPAQYGGRLSSVLDVKMNDGNNQNYNVSGGVGLISAKLNVEGPIQKGVSSFLVTGRRTYVDMFLKASKDTSIKNSRLYFYDLNMKLNYELGKRDKLYLSGYFGRDILGFGKQFSIGWGNGTGTLRWNHIFNGRLFSNTSLIYSNYDYKIQITSGANDFNIFSQIRDWNLKQDYQYSINSKNNLRFGWSSTYHVVRPGDRKSVV